jgi:Cu-processing system permease protein
MPILVLSKLTIVDLIRRRVFVLLALFAALMILLSFPMRELTIGQWRRLILDVGLGSSNLAAALIGILVGASLIAGDLDKKTLYPLLAKPISRASLVFGRYLGLVAVIFMLVASTAAGTAAILAFAKQSDYLGSLLQNSLTLAVSASLVGGVALFFSCATSSTLAAIAALTISIAGQLVSNLAYFGARVTNPASHLFLTIFSKILPNLEMLNLKDFASRAEIIPATDLLVRVGYGAGYALLAVSLGAVIFSMRDLK